MGVSPERPVDGGPDPAAGLDLSPRATAPHRPRRRVGAVLVLAALAVLAVVVVSQLRGSAQFFYNADEAVAQRSDLGDRSFRLQGTVVAPPETVDGDRVRFTVAFNDVEVDVDHTGAQPALFKEGIAVVCEGHWSPDGAAFVSTTLRTKHSEEYKAENPDRVETDQP